MTVICRVISVELRTFLSLEPSLIHLMFPVYFCKMSVWIDCDCSGV